MQAWVLALAHLWELALAHWWVQAWVTVLEHWWALECARRLLSSSLADHEVLSSHARLHDYKMDLLRSASTSSSTATQRRHLLQQASQDAQVDVTIFSETVGEMNQILQSTNVTLLGSFEILADPYTYTDNINNADEPISVVSPGFEVRGCFLTYVRVV